MCDRGRITIAKEAIGECQIIIKIKTFRNVCTICKSCQVLLKFRILLLTVCIKFLSDVRKELFELHVFVTWLIRK